MDLLPCPDNEVWDALELYESELKRWRAWPDQSSAWNDKGVIKYRYYLAEKLSVLTATSPSPMAVDEVVEMYRIPADLKDKVIKLCAMEAVLTSLKEKK